MRTRNIFTLLAVLAFLPLSLLSQIKFDEHFTQHTLRFDFILGGDHEAKRVYPQQIKKEALWAGSRTNLLNDMNYGTYQFRVVDAKSGRLIFSQGFSTLFQEWQTIAEAKTMNRAFYQAVFFPFPHRKVRLYLDHRDENGEFEPFYETYIDPEDYFIIRETTGNPDTTYIHYSGDPSIKVDLVFISEGYTSHERKKFIDDVGKMAEYLFTVSPFDRNKQHFNVVALFVPSQESGTDIPGRNVFRNTRFNSAFYTFDIDRYLTTSDMRSIYDELSGVSWDHFYVLVNSAEYGGGGFYNFMGISTSDHYLAGKVMVHELGHSFAGLGDEYYNSEVAYEDFYNLAVEPWEPNITTLVDFSSKWADLVPKNVPVPTPRIEKYAQVTGVFEGGGYMSKGIYSPAMDCRMKSMTPDEFCPVCQRGIQRVINRYIE